MMIKKATLCLLNIDTILRSMWQALKLDYVCCTGRCDVSVSCLMSHVSRPITDKSSPAPALSSLSRCIFLSSGSGQGTPEITRPGPDPASCQLTRKIPGLNWLSRAAKYFAETDCEYFTSGTETLGGTRRGRREPRFTIVRVWVAVWLSRRNLRYLMANSHIATLANRGSQSGLARRTGPDTQSLDTKFANRPVPASVCKKSEIRNPLSALSNMAIL